MKATEVILSLSALASEARLAVFRLLVKRGPEGFTPTELARRLGIPSPTLSFHLKELQRAGLLVSRRDGRFLHYSADFQQMQAVIGFLTEQCCSLADTTCDVNCKPVASPQRRRA